MKKLYYTLAAVLSAIVIALAAASFSKNSFQIYTSWYMLTLWAIAALIALILIIKNFNRKNIIYCLFHLSLIIILAGALLTHFFATSEDLHLRTGERKGDLTLQSFETEYYPQTKTPQNYKSTIAIVNGSQVKTEIVSMNKPLRTASRRIFLTSFDSDNLGVTFTITKDPFGTAATYFGYFLFFHCVPLVLYKRLRAANKK